MGTVLVTGCDSGIGRAFAEQYAAAGYAVVATYRDLAGRLPDRPGMRHLALDVTDAEQFAAARAALAGEPIDILVSNAGIGLDVRRLGDLDFAYVQRMLAVNTIGPLRLVESFVDNVAASRERRIVIVTSAMGAIGANLSGGHYGYRASKAGLNAIGRSLAIDLFPRGITVVMLHPGWVRTAGGSPDAPMTAAESVAAMRDVVRRLGNHQTGGFYTYAGQPMPW
ncbi:MAG: SDR family NAD(P)-dependent oxidoreductase [Alphaproteobacteria bacterium]|nr:SDR family NAD(P)-dependent oxidoreductase [Alphaproteobacteria bacterium]